MQKTRSHNSVIVLLASSVRGRRPTLVFERRVEDQIFRIQKEPESKRASSPFCD
jgi:hypothetical protein